MVETEAASGKQIRLLSFDIDNTVIDLQTKQGKFSRTWQHYKPQESPLLAYNSGRLYEDIIDLIDRKILAEPDFIIGGVGTHIYDYRAGKVLKEFDEILDEGWDLAVVESIMGELPLTLEVQPGKFQHYFKRSYFLDGATPVDIDLIEQQFSDSDLDVNVVYSGDRYLDILPKWANKGNALLWLLKSLQIRPQEVLVAGDSGNDAAMFDIKGIQGIAVSNAREELYQLTKYRQVYHAERAKDEGVIEGLIHFGLLPDQALDHHHSDDVGGESFFVQQQVEHPFLSKDQLSLISEGYDRAVLALKNCISKLGFLACATEYNIPSGTDENYHSVWARDGAITIIGALPILHDKEVHDCVRETFRTLLENTSINGQIPANVRLADENPDYSGVGGICSIDSGLWVIIALYEYTRVTRDIDFLQSFFPSLQKIMNWLSAQDSNNDALIEIPEAGDWTDLFGRSYHVLYDEVLWYRTNVCFGRILEMLGNYKEAGQYIRWSQVIKREINANFWPSTQQKLSQSVSFAEQQFSLGDTKYLVAQITPFDFSWRCDSYGNILAYLYDVIDYEKAYSALRFMLGVGINDPYPIKNVYPVVSPGDPDWRPYYAVNLLNLPNHYHNGGIWPFIGAMWVQFIDKLGQRELAMSELYKLAELNHRGINEEWEFNEWAHGDTGNPMGKIYQAWSAAQYIAACHKMKIK